MDYKDIIGVDETGVGDYFTPLVSVAAYIPKNNYNKVLELGVKDSKKLSNQQVIKLYFDLKDLIIFKQKKLTQRGYNKLTNSFNAHELKTLIHIGSIAQLEKEVKAEYIVLDEYASEKNWNKYVEHLSSSSLKIDKINTKIVFEQKAESKYVAVAVASIIARAILLFEMKKQNQKWDVKFPLGANPIVISVAKDFVKKYSREQLEEVAKISFKTTDKV